MLWNAAVPILNNKTHSQISNMHKDILGRGLSVGDFVTCDINVYRIEKFTTKMVTVVLALAPKTLPIKNPTKKSNPIHKYSSELTFVPEQDVILWLLKQPTKK